MAPNIDFRDSQSYVLGSGDVANVAGFYQLQLNAARDIMLGRGTLQCHANGGWGVISGDITNYTIQGQSLMASNQPHPARMLAAEAASEGANYIGAPLIANGVVQIDLANMGGAVANPVMNASIYTDPWDVAALGPVPPPDALGSSGLNYLVGLGTSGPAIAPGNGWQLQCTALRDVQLGMLYLEGRDVVNNNFLSEGFNTVTSIRINQTEQLSSNAAISLSCFSLLSKDEDLKTLGVIAPMNSTITITGFLNGGAPNNQIIRGGFFALPA